MERTLKNVILFVLVALLLPSLFNCKKSQSTEPDTLLKTTSPWVVVYERDPAEITNPTGYDMVDFQIELEKPYRIVKVTVAKVAKNRFEATVYGEPITYWKNGTSAVKNRIIVQDSKISNLVDMCSVSTGKNTSVYFIDGKYNVEAGIEFFSCSATKKSSYLKFWVKEK